MKILRILIVFIFIMLVFPFIAFSGDKNFYYFNGEKLEVIWRQSCDNGLTDFVKVYSSDKKEKHIIVQRRDDLRSFLIKGKGDNAYHIIDENKKIITLSAQEWTSKLSKFSPSATLFFLDRSNSDCEICVFNAFE